MSSNTGQHRRSILFLVGIAELLCMSLWFTASAVVPHFRDLWGLSPDQAAALTTAVQVGFVVGTALTALTNLADILSARVLFASAALLAAGANGLLVMAPGYSMALGLRFATGFLLAGVYPPAMKMIATWYKQGRGLAIGIVVGALTIGKATPYLVKALAGDDSEAVILAASGAAVLGALLIALFYGDGPYEFPRRPFSWRLVGTVASHRETALAIGGYLGHMWELYAMWTWVPVFLAASAAAAGADSAWVEIISFGAIASGGLGCVWGGWAADRWGRRPVVNLSMGISALCCLGIGLFFGLPLIWVAPAVWIWGFFVVADSAQFSAMVTEVAPQYAVGTALTLQTSCGFLLTTLTLHLVPRLAEGWGWPWAFPVLAFGPALGILAIRSTGSTWATRKLPQ